MSHLHTLSPLGEHALGPRRPWLLHLAQALALAPVLAASPAPPLPSPAATLALVEGHGPVRDRLLLLPGPVVGGLQLGLPALAELDGAAGPALLEALFSRPGAPDAGPPPRLGEAGVLFAEGSGAYRLRGPFRDEELQEHWLARGCEWTPRDDGGGFFDGPETWGVVGAQLVVGAWGARPRRAWLGELDGRGRRVHALAEVRPGELLRVWARADLGWGEGAVPLVDLAPRVPGPAPVGLERVGVRWRRHEEGVRQCLWLEPRRARDLDELGEWVRMLWPGAADAEVRRRRSLVEACWVEGAGSSRERLRGWAPRVAAWIAGDPYRAVQ